MKAKDTVIYELAQAIMSHPDLPMGQAIAIEQAEISFKAGTTEVLDWFMSHGYSGGPIEYSDGVKARFDPNWNDLTVKLVEWGYMEIKCQSIDKLKEVVQ